MLTIWGRTNSLNVQKALMALEEAGFAYERLDAGLAVRNRQHARIPGR